MKKKLFVVLLAMILTFVPVCSAFAEGEAETLSVSFTDVTDSNAWYYDTVQYVSSKGLMTGLNSNTFGVTATLSRAQFAVILWRMSGSPAMTYQAKFPDVARGTWYTDAVLWASSVGVVTGYQNGKFGPADTITREQMALMMYRYAAACGYDTSKRASFDIYSDAARVSGFAKEAMQWAVALGIITGKNNGTMLDPQGKAIRAECATIITRFMKKYVDKPTTAHPELAAYKEYLSNNNWIYDYKSSGTKTMAVFDLNQDGVYEVAAAYKGPGWADYTHVILSYDYKLKVIRNYACDSNSNVSYSLEYVNEAKGRYEIQPTRGKAIQYFYRMDVNGTSYDLDSFFYPYSDSWSSATWASYNDLSSGMKEPVYVTINTTNLNTYLTGNGKSTGFK